LSDDYNTADIPETGTVTLPLSALLESLLFVADGPVPVSQFATALEATPRVIESALEELETLYQHRGLRIQRDKAGIQLTTAPQTAEAVEKFLGLDSTQRLSRPAVETLAIIAYQQPITRPRIEAIRGVNSDGVIKSLLTKGLVEEVGRTEGPGRPVLYSTTPAFLQHFGLSSTNELPPLDIEVLMAAARVIGPENDPVTATSADTPDEPTYDEPATEPVANLDNINLSPSAPLDTDIITSTNLENESMLNTPEVSLLEEIADSDLVAQLEAELTTPLPVARDDDDDDDDEDEEEEDDDWVDDDVDDEEEDEEDDLDEELEDEIEEEVEEEIEELEDEEEEVVVEDEEEELEEEDDEDDWEDDDDEDLDILEDDDEDDDDDDDED
jgi:segregation and condensation protein B